MISVCKGGSFFFELPQQLITAVAQQDTGYCHHKEAIAVVFLEAKEKKPRIFKG